MYKRIILAMWLGLSLLGLMKTEGFALTENERILQRGLDAQKLGHYGEAFQWFRIAAESGNSEAQYHMGYCCLAGQGIRLDEKQAVKWFRKAADQGNGRGAFCLGSCYEHGWGVAMNAEEAKKYYQTATQMGFKGAVNALKHLQPTPSTKMEDEKSGTTFTNVLSNGGDQDVTGWVMKGKVDFKKRNYSVAATLFKKAADQGNAEGEYRLAYCFYIGKGEPKDKDTAKVLFQNAASQGFEPAQNALSQMKSGGVLIPDN